MAAIPADAPPGIKRLANAVFLALRNFGFIVSDTSGGAHVQFEANHSAESMWRDLGVWPAKVASNGREYPRDIMDHILTSSSRLRALAS